MDQLDMLINNDRSPEWLREAARSAAVASKHNAMDAANGYEQLAHAVRQRWLQGQVA